MTILSILQGKKAQDLPVITSLDGTETMYFVTAGGVSKQGLSSLIPGLLTSVGFGPLLASNNLADLQDIAVAKQNLHLGNMADQNANTVAITGGSINGTPVGSSTPAAGKFTNLTVTGNLLLPPGSIPAVAIQGPITNEQLQNKSFSTALANGLTGDPSVDLGGTLHLGIGFVDGGTF